MEKGREYMIIQALRGSFIESFHHVHYVVVDSEGKIVEQSGEPFYITYPRSSVKMIQSLPFIMEGAFDHFHLHEQALALAVASHQGEDFHISLLEEWKEKVGLENHQFCCGAHWPVNFQAQKKLIQTGIEPSPLHNNCSGKHAAMMTLAKLKNETVHEYGNYDSPTQERIRKIMSHYSGADHRRSPWGVDGCGIPTYAVPLKNLAQMMAIFFTDSAKNLSFPAAQLVTQAMQNFPEMVSGSDSFNSKLLTHFGDKMIAKAGAEGVYCGAFLKSGHGFAIKAQDGAQRAVESALLELMKNQNVLTNETFEKHQSWLNPKIKNWKGEITGEMIAL